jgi:dTDP-4-dehydrorhamnose reductase
LRKVLITGANGFIATYLDKLAPNEIDIYFTSRKIDFRFMESKLLVTNLLNIEEMETFIINNNIDTIIHGSGNANVDYVEKYLLEGIQSNLLTTINLIYLAKKYNLFFVFLSSNAIFDGTRPLYHETSTANPLNRYGLIKYTCEELIKNSQINYCIARPILTYGWNINNTRENPVTFVIKNLKQRKKLNIVSDIFENPIYVNQLAEIIWKIVLHRFTGIIHLAGGSILSRYELAIKIAEIFSLDHKLIQKTDSSYFKHLAPRPTNTSFNTDRLIATFKIKPITIDEGLKNMKENLPK